MLELHGVGVCYRRKNWLRRGGEEFWALRDVSMTLRRGETLGVIGRNGAGKSTLLRLLAGIIRPDRGSVTTFGHHATLLSLQVGFVPHLSGRENVILSGLLLGLTWQRIQSVMSRIVEFSELGEFIDEPIQTYSSGMRARLGFSIAFHADPDILLVDETLGVGDAAFVKKSTAVMRERMRSDKTVTLVSHNPASVRSLCDRAVWIEGGTIRSEGDPEEVLGVYDDWWRRNERRDGPAHPPDTTEQSPVIEEVR